MVICFISDCTRSEIIFYSFFAYSLYQQCFKQAILVLMVSAFYDTIYLSLWENRYIFVWYFGYHAGENMGYVLLDYDAM
jgi:hypothetical protein